MMTPPLDPLLVIEGLGKTFVDVPGGTQALAEISFRVAEGELVAIVGPSGCGKSTLLRIIADLSPPTVGRVLVCGRPPSEARELRLAGMVFQTPVLYAWRTVRSNVELPLEVEGTPKPERARRSRDILDLVGLMDQADRYPRQLSGGMQQRVALARALISRPRLLLMDEPFGALDEIARERLNLEVLRVRRETGVTVLLVTHDIDEAVFVADRVLVLTPRPGRLAAEVPVDLARPRGQHTRLEPRYFELISAVRQVLRDTNAAEDELLETTDRVFAPAVVG